MTHFSDLFGMLINAVTCPCISCSLEKEEPPQKLWSVFITEFSFFLACIFLYQIQLNFMLFSGAGGKALGTVGFRAGNALELVQDSSAVQWLKLTINWLSILAPGLHQSWYKTNNQHS